MAAKCIESANSYRSLHHNTPKLTWDAQLASKAQAYAEHLRDETLKSGTACLKHDPACKQDPKCGENLFYAMVPKVGGEDVGYFGEKANLSWYGEIKDWDFTKSDRKPGGGATGHFTQLVWVNTTKVGYGYATGPSPGNPSMSVVFVVAKFQEPGNFHMAGKRDECYSSNVQPLKDPSTVEKYSKPAATSAPVRSTPASTGATSSSTSMSTKIVNGVKVTTKTVKTVKNGEETVEVFENDVLKKKTVNGKEQKI